MELDTMTACPMCPRRVRDFYVIGRRILPTLPRERPEVEEFAHALEELRPWYDAHHANQLHAFSPELEAAREGRPSLPTVSPDQAALDPLDARD